MSVEHIAITPSVLYFGAPVVLVTTCNPDGTANITPVSSAWALGRRIVVGFGTEGRGISNLLRDGECTLNFASAELWSKVERIAATTGLKPVTMVQADAGYRHESDKFALGGFTRIGSELVRPLRVAECPFQLEAQLLSSRNGISENANSALPYIIVELSVLRVHAHTSVVVPGSHRVDTTSWRPLLYVFRHYFGCAIDLGRSFRAGN